MHDFTACTGTIVCVCSCVRVCVSWQCCRTLLTNPVTSRILSSLLLLVSRASKAHQSLNPFCWWPRSVWSEGPQSHHTLEAATVHQAQPAQLYLGWVLLTHRWIFGLLTVRIDTKVHPGQRSANRQNCCSLEFHANNRFRSRRAVYWSSSTVSSNDTQTGKPVHSRHWCRRITGSPVYSSAAGTMAGLVQTHASGSLVAMPDSHLEWCRALPSKPPQTQPQLPQTFAVGVCPKLIQLQVLVSCAANLPRYTTISMTA